MKKILITGQSGSGKSFLSKKFREFGVNAIDADTLKELTIYVDGRGKKVIPPHPVTLEFVNNHKLIWDKVFLAKYLKESSPIFFFGQSGNTFDVVDQFDDLYYLKVEPEILKERLKSEERENSWGKKEEEYQEIIKWLTWMDDKAEKLGFKMIDASLAPDEIFNRIK